MSVRRNFRAALRLLTLASTFAALLAAQHAPVESAWDLLAKGDRAHAIQTLREIIRVNPRDADARLLLGSVLAEDGEQTESLVQLTEAVRLRPGSAEAQNTLGEAARRFGRIKTARTAFEKAVALDAGFEPAQENLGMSLVDAGEFAAAAPHLDRALRALGSKPDAAYPHYLRAKIYSEQGDFKQASAHLLEAVTLQPDFAEAWSDLGQVRKALLDNTGALAAFQHAVAAGPDDAVAQYRLGSEYLHQGMSHLAAQHLSKAFDLNRDDQSTLYSLQIALREDGRMSEAALMKTKLAELLRKRDQRAQNSLTAVQLNNQGAALEKAGDVRTALEKYRAALELCPDHVGFRTNVGAALLHLGRVDEGIAELREVLRRDPENEAVRMALDHALAQTHQSVGR